MVHEMSMKKIEEGHEIDFGRRLDFRSPGPIFNGFRTIERISWDDNK